MKNLWYSIKSIILSYLAQLITAIIIIIIYLTTSNNPNKVLEDTNTLYGLLILVTSISVIPITFYLYKKYYIKETKINYKNLFMMIPTGISLSLLYNMLTIELIKDKTVMDLNIIIIIIYTVILGPIFEEILFRYISLRKAKEVYQERKAIILISLIFALMHTGIINIIYAFIIGIILSLIYKKYKNILYPIIFHISANLTSIFLKEFNWILLIISLFLSLMCIIYYKKQKQ